MPRYKKKEKVSISYHYFVRKQNNSDGDEFNVPFTSDEFQELFVKLEGLKGIDLRAEDVNHKVRYKSLALMESLINENPRTIHGIYRTSYWGHAYENEEKGIISAESLNLRNFFFLLYHAEDGKIYIATQYLGNFGGYTAIKNTVMSLLNSPQEIQSISYRVDGLNLSDCIPIELKIGVSKQSTSITGRNLFGSTAALSFKKPKDGEKYTTEIKEKLLKNLHLPSFQKKRIIKELLRSHELIEVDDDEIEDCEVIVKFDTFTQKIYIIGESNFASKLPVAVSLDSNGHPLYNPLKDETIRMLQEQILSTTS